MPRPSPPFTQECDFKGGVKKKVFGIKNTRGGFGFYGGRVWGEWNSRVQQKAA